MSERRRKDFSQQAFGFFGLGNEMFFQSSPLMVQQKFFDNAA
jgi:hypothetical protein